jgi:acyl-coenzyme A thioesterase PaaI-like protein
MTMLDMAMSSAALSKADFKKAVITVDMSTHFLSPGKGRLVAHGRASGGGKSICFCEAHIEDEAGRTVARAMGAFKYVDPHR